MPVPFLLPGIDPKALIELHYPSQGHVEIRETPVEADSFSIVDLLHEKKRAKGVYYFFDSHKYKIKNWINMWDMHRNQALPRYTVKPCWWCREQFTWHPLGCPIRYNPHVPTGEKKDAFEQKMRESNLPCDTNDFFETEGVFCSFPCVKAYIVDMCQKNSGGRYQDSCTYLTLLYYKLYGTVISIPEAGTWKVLEPWGGHLTVDEFRQTFGKLTYEETCNVRRPYMYCSSVYIKEQRV